MKHLLNRRHAHAATSFALAASLTACSTNNFTDYNLLGGLRVLAIVADTPEVNPGATVTFTPVLSDLYGSGRALTYSVRACVDPGIGIGASPTCPTADAGTTLSGSVTPPAGIAQTYTGPVTTFSLAMPAAATIFAGRSTADQYNGVAYVVIYAISAPGGPTVTSFLRVIVSSTTKTTKNTNPTITSVDFNDSPVAATLTMPTAGTNLRVTSPASAAETYSVMQSDGSFKTQTEELINTWFISDGNSDFERTLGNTENFWSPPSNKPSTHGVVILAVTRDGHNGMAFQKVEMN